MNKREKNKNDNRQRKISNPNNQSIMKKINIVFIYQLYPIKLNVEKMFKKSMENIKTLR